MRRRGFQAATIWGRLRALINVKVLLQKPIIEPYVITPRPDDKLLEKTFDSESGAASGPSDVFDLGQFRITCALQCLWWEHQKVGSPKGRIRCTVTRSKICCRSQCGNFYYYRRVLDCGVPKGANCILMGTPC